MDVNVQHENTILISVIMAAYNSEETIEKSLKSIREQTFCQDQIEIIVADGGSTDNTVAIAKKYGSIVINNERRLPEIAKMLGLKRAKGKYILIMDSDEVMCNKDILKKRFDVLEEVHEIKSLQGGCQIPLDMKVKPCTSYINEVGDPFSCFVYRTYRGGAMTRIIIDKASYDKDHSCYIGRFNKDDIRPIGDSVTMMDREYIMAHCSDMIENECTTAAIYDKIVTETGYTAYIKDDKNYHYSSASVKTFLKKIKFRIINNIFDVKGSGYSAAAKINPTLNRRKYLFPFYTATVIWPIVHGIKMSIVYRHPIFLLHPVFSFYVVFQIVFQYSKKLLHIKSVNSSYAK